MPCTKLIAVTLLLQTPLALAVRGERSRPARDLQDGNDNEKRSKQILQIFHTPAPSAAPSAAPTAFFERFFEIDVEVDGEDASVLFNSKDDIEDALLVGYNTLADDLSDPFNVRMESAELDSITIVTDDGRRLRRTAEDARRVLQMTNATQPPRRRSRATASLTSRGICNGCPPTQRFTTSVAASRRLVRRALQGDDVPTLDDLLSSYNDQAEEEATGIREFDVPPTLSPTSAPSATPSSQPSKAPTRAPTPSPTKKTTSKSKSR